MGFYNKHILPKLIQSACTQDEIMRQREKVVPLAKGRVLEVGFGSGLNLPLYDASAVEHVWGLDPSLELADMARPLIEAAHFSVEHLASSAEAIALDNHSADTVVITYTMCTIPDVLASLTEMRRVLKPGGKLLFCEHGLAPDKKVQRWQAMLTPVWKRLGGGCHLNRDIPALLKDGGFELEKVESMYVPGWKLASYNYWGKAYAK